MTVEKKAGTCIASARLLAGSQGKVVRAGRVAQDILMKMVREQSPVA